jgi:hypothetical protein
VLPRFRGNTGQGSVWNSWHQAVDNGTIAALPQKDQPLAYVLYASVLLLFLRLAFAPFSTACGSLLRSIRIAGVRLFPAKARAMRLLA